MLSKIYYVSIRAATNKPVPSVLTPYNRYSNLKKNTLNIVLDIWLTPCTEWNSSNHTTTTLCCWLNIAGSVTHTEWYFSWVLTGENCSAKMYVYYHCLIFYNLCYKLNSFFLSVKDYIQWLSDNFKYQRLISDWRL